MVRSEQFFEKRKSYDNPEEFFSQERMAQCNRYERINAELGVMEMKQFVDFLRGRLGDFVLDYLPPWIQLEVVTET